MSLNTGDLVMLTAIGTVFPTSDHFHGVTTLAMLVMGRFLGQRMPQELEDFAVGTYLSILFIQYQQLSKRYVPELVKFSVNTLLSLAPVASPDRPGLVPVHLPTRSFRIKHAQEIAVRKLGFGDCKAPTNDQVGDTGSVSVAVLSTTVAVIAAAAEIWKGKPAFFETFGPLSRVVAHLTTKPCKSQLPAALNQEIERVHGMLERMLRVAQLSRRPLELHHHRPIAIRTYIPKFEDSFNPDKHYDPNRERAESAKLKAEHKKERKGAMRELRKDANFMAREKLKAKKAKDEAYDKKFKRLVADIQGEEGREANAYEREKTMRKRAKNR